MARCANRCKPTPLPPSFPIEQARTHPRYRHRLEPGAQCEHEADHDGPHRNGCLVWHDPPRIVVGGVPYEAPHTPWTLFGQLVSDARLI